MNRAVGELGSASASSLKPSFHEVQYPLKTKMNTYRCFCVYYVDNRMILDWQDVYTDLLEQVHRQCVSQRGLPLEENGLGRHCDSEP